jgi:hypothetical protein
MTTLDQIPATADPVHLLAVADSKVGKSVYAAQAAIDGFNVVYVDADNGISALRYMLKDKPDAMKRVHYFGTDRPVTFLTNFLRSTTLKPFTWVPSKNRLWSKLSPDLVDEDIVWRFDQSQIPHEWVFDADSWTAVAADALGIGSADQKAELLEGTNQGIYGEASSQLTYICNMLQKVPYHVIIQAHGTRYEIYDKPLNTLGSQMKQNVMTLREIKDVPVSSSRPHGETMVSRFNHIGWLSVTNLGETEIDFTRKPTRVGGGPPNRKAKVSELPFSKLTHGVPPQPTEVGQWFLKTTHGELKK